MINRAERISKLALRLAKIQNALKKEGLHDVELILRDANLKLVSHGLKAYSEEYQKVD